MKGADPELFVTRNGNIIPVVGLLGGTKTRPLKVNRGSIQEDNVCAEIGIDGANSEDEWVEQLTAVLEQTQSRLTEHGCDLLAIPSFDFDRGVLLEAGPQALVAGCEPDFNAWKMQTNPRPRLGTLRAAGGHIHVDVQCDTMMDSAMVVRKHDLFLGVPSVLMDDDVERIKLYGQAGCFRPKSYGVEYRSLSNHWLVSEDRMRWAYRNSERALAFDGEVPPYVEECINNHDVELAQQLIDQYQLEVVA